jgi:hypothetical protein
VARGEVEVLGTGLAAESDALDRFNSTKAALVGERATGGIEYGANRLEVALEFLGWFDGGCPRPPPGGSHVDSRPMAAGGCWCEGLSQQ